LALAGPQLSLGVDVGGTKMLSVVLNQRGSVETSVQQASPTTRGELAVQVEAVANRICAGAPAALGVGVPAWVDGGGHIRFSPHLPGVVGEDLLVDLQRAFPRTPLWLGNDASAACFAEQQIGAARGCSEVLMVTVGTGIGGGVVSRGRLLEGANGFAGEFGHMVVDPNGPRCPCGKRGCWERYASGAGLGALAREAALAGEAPTLVELAGNDPAAAGDPAGVVIMQRFAWWLALGLASLANAFDPEVIVVGGGVAAASPVLMEPLRKSFFELVEAPGARRRLRVEPAALGAQAGAVGAALLAGAKASAR
jgi:glucokinase